MRASVPPLGVGIVTIAVAAGLAWVLSSPVGALLAPEQDTTTQGGP